MFQQLDFKFWVAFEWHEKKKDTLISGTILISRTKSVATSFDEMYAHNPYMFSKHCPSDKTMKEPLLFLEIFRYHYLFQVSLRIYIILEYTCRRQLAQGMMHQRVTHPKRICIAK